MCYSPRSKACEWVLRVVLEVRRITNGECQWLALPSITHSHTHICTHTHTWCENLVLTADELAFLPYYVAGMLYAGITWEFAVTLWNTKSVVFIFLYLVPERQVMTLHWGVSCSHQFGTHILGKLLLLCKLRGLFFLSKPTCSLMKSAHNSVPLSLPCCGIKPCAEVSRTPNSCSHALMLLLLF